MRICVGLGSCVQLYWDQKNVLDSLGLVTRSCDLCDMKAVKHTWVLCKNVVLLTTEPSLHNFKVKMLPLLGKR